MIPYLKTFLDILPEIEFLKRNVPNNCKRFLTKDKYIQYIQIPNSIKVFNELSRIPYLLEILDEPEIIIGGSFSLEIYNTLMGKPIIRKSNDIDVYITKNIHSVMPKILDKIKSRYSNLRVEYASYVLNVLFEKRKLQFILIPITSPSVLSLSFDFNFLCCFYIPSKDQFAGSSIYLHYEETGEIIYSSSSQFCSVYRLRKYDIQKCYCICNNFISQEFKKILYLSAESNLIHYNTRYDHVFIASNLIELFDFKYVFITKKIKCNNNYLFYDTFLHTINFKNILNNYFYKYNNFNDNNNYVESVLHYICKTLIEISNLDFIIDTEIFLDFKFYPKYNNEGIFNIVRTSSDQFINSDTIKYKQSNFINTQNGKTPLDLKKLVWLKYKDYFKKLDLPRL